MNPRKLRGAGEDLNHGLVGRLIVNRRMTQPFRAVPTIEAILLHRDEDALAAKLKVQE